MNPGIKKDCDHCKHLFKRWRYCYCNLKNSEILFPSSFACMELEVKE